MSPGLQGLNHFLPLDSTSLVWKSSEEVILSLFFFFLKRIWFRVYVFFFFLRSYSSLVYLHPPPIPPFWLPSFFLGEKLNVLWYRTSLCSGCLDPLLLIVSRILLASKALTKDFFFLRFKLMTSCARICRTLNFLGSVITNQAMQSTTV